MPDRRLAFQAAINAAANAGQYTVTIPSWIRVINLADTITLDISKTSINLNGCALSFQNLGAGKYGFQLTNSLTFVSSHRRMFLPLYNGAIWRRDGSGNSQRDDSYNNYIPDTKVVKSVCNSAGADNMTVTTSDVEFNLHNFTAQNGSWDAGDRVCPPYASHLQITFDLTSMDASASTYNLLLSKFSVAFI